jgi:putative Tad-like protein involved in Flp pilus assembly
MTRPTRRGERGQVLALAGLTLMVFFAFAVVAVDIGRLALTANEVQSVADIAATAGATAAWEGQDAVAQARSVVSLNAVNGATASIEASDVIVGSYDPMTGTFTPNGAPTNAVRANAMATVNNILAMIFGTASTTVEKTSTAVFTTVQSATPTLPLVIGSCYFDSLCPTCMPELTRAPSRNNNSAWTSFFTSTTSTTAGTIIKSFIPNPCGGGVTPPELNVGQSIKLNGNKLSSVLLAVQCMVSNGQREFVVPVVRSQGGGDDDDDSDGGGDSDEGDDPDDGGDHDDDDNDGDSDSGSEDNRDCSDSLDQTGRVVGFVTVHVDSVQATGDIEQQGINLHGIFNGGVPGTPGGSSCTKCGSGHVVIVN